MRDKLFRTEDEIILDALHASSTLRACILEMIGIAGAELRTLDRGDAAEEAVVEVMGKTSKAILEKWAEKKEAEAHRAMKDQGYRPHRKKT